MFVSTRTTPRISINKLAEYATTTDPRRRRSIVKDQKKPQRYIVTLYEPAQDAIVNCLVDGNTDALIEARMRLQEARAVTDWEETRNTSCLEAIDRFQRMRPALLREIDGMTITRGHPNGPKLHTGGVDISVRPELTLEGERRGKTVHGAIKLHFSKNHTLVEVAGEYVATVLHQYIERFNKDATADHRLCFSVDVFGQSIEKAPRSFVARRKTLATSCEEIALWWDKIEV